MYNCMKLHTGSAVARVTKDRAARPHIFRRQWKISWEEEDKEDNYWQLDNGTSGLSSTEKELTDQKDVRH